MRFVENRGQWNKQARFRAEADGVTLWFGTESTLYQFVRPGTIAEPETSGIHPPTVEQFVMKSRLLNARTINQPIGIDQFDTRTSYLRGNDPSQWRTAIPAYRSIIYPDVYPGIDLHYYSAGGQIEYDFVVAPGADPTVILIQYSGINALTINDAGDMEITTNWGVALEQAPLIYQTDNAGRQTITGKFQLESDDTFGFELTESYDPGQPLIIDPILVYSTFLGGSDVDEAYDIAVDNDGHAYMAGYTVSTDFPVVGEYQLDQTSFDVFVTKMNVAGDDLVFSTYLSGSDSEWCKGLALDNDGNVYLTGHTGSSDFPTINPYQTFTGSVDVFVSKLNATGDSLIYSTWLGGSESDWGTGIAVDGNGSAYVTGGTLSADFPTRTPFQSTGSGDDAFVTKFNANGNALMYSTYLGGSGQDAGSAIAVDFSGSAYITGYTHSSNFPVYNHYQGYQGFRDAFVTKLNSQGTAPLYSTFLGGSNHDEAFGIAIAAGNYACVTGQTYSADFPVMTARQSYRDNGDAFVTKLSMGGDQLIFSTPIGGTDTDLGAAIDTDPYGAIYVTGDTYSADFPTRRSRQTYGGQGDVFVVKLPANGTSIIYNTYLGGTDTDEGNGIAASDATYAYVTGNTQSSDFPILGAYQSAQTSTSAFCSKLDEDICCVNRVGDVNGLGGDNPTLGDVVVMLDAKYIAGTCEDLIDCMTEADIDRSGGDEPVCDDITLEDINILIDYLFITGPSLGLDDCP